MEDNRRKWSRVRFGLPCKFVEGCKMWQEEAL